MTRDPSRIIAPDDPRHGTENGYVNLLCRCPACREAHAEWTRAARRRRATRLAPDDVRHGKDSTYNNHHCRCRKCLAAHVAARGERKRIARIDVPGLS